LWDEDRFRFFENTLLIRICEPKMDEVAGEWRKLHKRGLNNLYPSPSIVRVIKSRRVRWARHVARMGERRGVYRVWWGNLKERDDLGDRGIDGRIILKWIFTTWDVGAWTGLIWLRKWTGGGLL